MDINEFEIVIDIAIENTKKQRQLTLRKLKEDMSNAKNE